jgi:hypothetical protein
MENCDSDKPRSPDGSAIPDNSGRERPPAGNSAEIPQKRDHRESEPGRIAAGHEEEIRDFVSRLTDQERMLILLKKELYEGSWQAMASDLSNRLDGKPYIFKLANRIRDDIDRIEKLRDFESKHNVDLAEFVNPKRP